MFDLGSFDQTNVLYNLIKLLKVSFSKKSFKIMLVTKLLKN